MSSAPIPAADFSEFLRNFTEATARLQETHLTLTGQVERLQAELAEANDRLRRSRSLAALGEMAAGIAHEIRNPLGAIALHAEMLKEDVGDRPEAASSVDKIQRATGRLERIVRDVLSFARDTRVAAVSTNAAQIFELVIEDCESVLVNEGVAIHVEINGACALAADSALLAQALGNLVRNAAEAMRGCARRDIVLGAREARLRTTDGGRREFVVLSVEDSGPGIPAEARERIFNPFFTTRAEGTGLGLAIVHRIIDAHGGMTACAEAVQLNSNGTHGARIELSLPLVPLSTAAADGVSLGEAVRRRVSGQQHVQAIA